MTDVLYKSESNEINIDGEWYAYYFDVALGDEDASPDRPYLVRQIDMDEEGEVWDCTPVAGFESLEAAKLHIEEIHNS